jgi:hypothetical protein
MSRSRKASLAAGVFYLISFVSIPTLVLYGPAHSPDYILGPGPDGPLLWGLVLEVIVALAGIGSAVALFPAVRRQNEGVALGFVASRTLEGAVIFVGVVSLFSLVTLRRDSAGLLGADPAPLITTGRSLVALYDATFLFGQSTIPGVNALLLGYLLYRSGLVPRVLPLVGLVGGPLILISRAATVLGVIDRSSAWFVIAALPIIVWELSLGVWLVVKGFRPCAITAEMDGGGATPARPPAVV